MSSKTKHEGDPAGEIRALSTLLSQLLIAFTIELDNEFERRMPHRTTSFGSFAGIRTAWLGSLVLWANAMRLVPKSGMTIAELVRQARTDKLQLPGLERWGYVSITPVPAESGKKSKQDGWLVTPTPTGLVAQETWRPLAGEIEVRWRERFGPDTIAAARTALAAVLGRIDLPMPEYLPIVGYGLFSQIRLEQPQSSDATPEAELAQMSLCTLWAKVLLAYTIEFEFDWKISLPVSANILRLLDGKGVRIADLPRLSGISKEGVAFATGWLERNGYAALEPDSKTGKGKLIRLTSKGEEAQQAYLRRLAIVDDRWRERFGEQTIAALRESLTALILQKIGGQFSLAEGLMPYPDGWRARKPYLLRTLAFIADPGGSLPHHPMVLHRGGYPDGS
jgi:DNA-binding MarR family transcriptional regulator